MSERKRRSRFDVPPDDPSILSLTSTTNIPISAHGNEGESLSEKTTQAIATIQQQLKSLSSSSSWIPVEDFKFRQRLEDSLHKNFDYIYRKDMFPDEFLKAKKARDVNNTSKRANNDSDMQSRHLGGIGTILQLILIDILIVIVIYFII